MASDQVLELDVGVVPEAAVSGPLLLQDDWTAFLTFNAMVKRADGRREPAGTAIVELVSCSCTRFGYPNDEALPGHPLSAKGLEAYGVFEVRNSTWVAQLQAQNRVAFPKSSGWTGARHFVFTFHDSTLECIADVLAVSVSREPYDRILAHLAERLPRRDNHEP
jgi:hypothetical protein